MLGWSPGGDAEFLRTPELIAQFALGGVSRTNGVFDRPKLEWFNSNICRNCRSRNCCRNRGRTQAQRPMGDEWSSAPGHEWFSKTVDLLRPRVRLLPDFSTWARAFFTDDFEYDPRPAKRNSGKTPKFLTLMRALADALAALPEWNHDACDHALRAVAEAGGVKAGLLINATRVAIVGQAVAPPLFDTMLALGRERVVRRLRAAFP